MPGVGNVQEKRALYAGMGLLAVVILTLSIISGAYETLFPLIGLVLVAIFMRADRKAVRKTGRERRGFPVIFKGPTDPAEPPGSSREK